MRTGKVISLLLLCLALIETAVSCFSDEPDEKDSGTLLSRGKKKSEKASSEPAFRPEYKGCYLDSKVEPDFTHYGGSRDRGMTKTQCATICREKSATYMGVQATDCWCGSLYGNYGVRHNEWCSFRCQDEPAARCGATGFNSVYALKPGT